MNWKIKPRFQFVTVCIEVCIHVLRLGLIQRKAAILKENLLALMIKIMCLLKMSVHSDVMLENSSFVHFQC